MPSRQMDRASVLTKYIPRCKAITPEADVYLHAGSKLVTASALQLSVIYPLLAQVT